MVPFDQLRILSQDLPELYRRHIFMPFPAQEKRVIIFADRFIDRRKLVGIRLQDLNIFRCKVSAGLKIFADHPFAQSRHYLSCFKIYQSQKIPCLYILFIVNKTLLQISDRP